MIQDPYICFRTSTNLWALNGVQGDGRHYLPAILTTDEIGTS